MCGGNPPDAVAPSGRPRQCQSLIFVPRRPGIGSTDRGGPVDRQPCWAMPAGGGGGCLGDAKARPAVACRAAGMITCIGPMSGRQAACRPAPVLPPLCRRPLPGRRRRARAAGAFLRRSIIDCIPLHLVPPLPRLCHAPKLAFANQTQRAAPQASSGSASRSSRCEQALAKPPPCRLHCRRRRSPAALASPPAPTAATSHPLLQL